MALSHRVGAAGSSEDRQMPLTSERALQPQKNTIYFKTKFELKIQLKTDKGDSSVSEDA